jgi:hypothetical protein
MVGLANGLDSDIRTFLSPPVNLSADNVVTPSAAAG